MGTLNSSMSISVFRMASLPSGLVGACKPGFTPFVRVSGPSKHTSLPPTRSLERHREQVRHRDHGSHTVEIHVQNWPSELGETLTGFPQ